MTSTAPRLFHLERDTDITGVSGTGRVADGVQWPDGTVALRWIGDRPSTVHWDSVLDVAAIHGHGGATRIVWADEQPDRAALRDRIARAVTQLHEAGGLYALDTGEARRIAGAVLAVLPEPADRAAVLREAADAFRALFGDVVVKGQDGDWANVADYIATGARIPACGSFYPHHTDTRCVLHKGHKGSHRAPWGVRDMAWPYDPRETQPAAGARQDGDQP